MAMNDEERGRLRSIERGLSEVMDFMDHGPMMMMHPAMRRGGPPVLFDHGFRKPYPPRDYHALPERTEEPMSTLPVITADTADELNEKTAAAKAEQARQAAIAKLAGYVKEADQMREDARAKLKEAKAARKALKGVRSNPDATVEEINAAIEASKL
jgi:hypothetical protein